MRYKTKIPALSIVASLLLYGSVAIASQNAIEAETIRKMQTLQIPFIENIGQANEEVKYYSKTFGGATYVTNKGEIVYVIPTNINQINTQQCKPETIYKTMEISGVECCLPAHIIKTIVLKELVLGDKACQVIGKTRAETYVNYFVGDEPEKWKTNIPTYQTVSLGEVYSGIGLKLLAHSNNVEKLFTVKPNVNPETIKLSLSGAKTLSVNGEGQLEVETAFGTVKFTKPVAYQEINGKRVDVAVEYKIQKSEIRNSKFEIRNPKSKVRNSKFAYGFKVAAYDRTKELIIDPLLASTFLGGSGNDAGYSIAINQNGNIYVTGYTYSTDFPTIADPKDRSFNGNIDVFVSKLNSGLTKLLASTYLGGSGDDTGRSIATNQGGNIYITGDTNSTNFPTKHNAYNKFYNGGHTNDVFIAKLNNGLTKLLASTYLGGSSYDEGKSIAIATDGSVYVTGRTNSSDYPTTKGTYDSTKNDEVDYYSDVFISKLNSGLTKLLRSTYLGGNACDLGYSIALYGSENVYIAGNSSSTDFPTTSGAYKTTQNGVDDIIISKLDSYLTKLLASTYLGGSKGDLSYSIVLDRSKNVYVVGYTSSTDFPTTAGAYNTTSNGSDNTNDVVISKLDGSLTKLLASTYLGGSDNDVGYSTAIDSSGSVYVTSCTGSNNFPVTSGAYDTTYNGITDAAISKLDANLTTLLASTYLGGSGHDACASIAIGKSGDVYLTGYSGSANYPTKANAYNTAYNSSGDSFVSKFDLNLSADISTTPTPTATPTTCNVAVNMVTDPIDTITITKDVTDDITVALTGIGGCPVSGVVVKSRSRSLAIKVSPKKYITDTFGTAEFDITGKKSNKTAKIVFKSGKLKKIIKVTVE